MAMVLIENSETVGTTEWSLSTDTSWSAADAQTGEGVVCCVLDLNALANGDEIELRCYEKVNSGATQRLVRKWTFQHAQAEPIFVSPSMMLKHGWDFSLIKLTGTDRSIAWSIRRLAT
jgi:hypothetical protein